MIFNSLMTQLVMAAVSLGIIFTYVQPAFLNIGTIQAAVEQYKTELLKVDEVNTMLETLVSRVNNMSEEDNKTLLTYMPDKIDHVAVSRDIYIMSKQSGAYLDSVLYDGIKSEKVLAEESDKKPVRHAFKAQVSGTYSQIKDFLSLLELSNYPLEVHEFSLTSTEKSLIKVELTIITYSRI